VNTHPSCDLLAAATNLPSPLVDLQQKKPSQSTTPPTQEITNLWKIDPQR